MRDSDWLLWLEALLSRQSPIYSQINASGFNLVQYLYTGPEAWRNKAHSHKHHRAVHAPPAALYSVTASVIDIGPVRNCTSAHKLTMNSRHNLTKSKFSAMLHRQLMQSAWRLQTEKLPSFTWWTHCAWAAVCTQNPICVRNYITILQHAQCMFFVEGQLEAHFNKISG